MEKYWITKYFDDPNLLNKKSELINKYRHQNKTLLMNVKGSMFLQYLCNLFYFYLLGRTNNKQIPEDCITHET